MNYRGDFANPWWFTEFIIHDTTEVLPFANHSFSVSLITQGRTSSPGYCHWHRPSGEWPTGMLRETLCCSAHDEHIPEWNCYYWQGSMLAVHRWFQSCAYTSHSYNYTRIQFSFKSLTHILLSCSLEQAWTARHLGYPRHRSPGRFEVALSQNDTACKRELLTDWELAPWANVPLATLTNLTSLFPESTTCMVHYTFVSMRLLN